MKRRQVDEIARYHRVVKRFRTRSASVRSALADNSSGCSDRSRMIASCSARSCGSRLFREEVGVRREELDEACVQLDIGSWIDPKEHSDPQTWSSTSSFRRLRIGDSGDANIGALGQPGRKVTPDRSFHRRSCGLHRARGEGAA